MSRLPPMLSRQFVESRARRRTVPEVFPVRSFAPTTAIPHPAASQPSPGSRPAPGEPTGRHVFEVDGWTDRLGRLASRYQRQMIALGNLESRLFAEIGRAHV